MTVRVPTLCSARAPSRASSLAWTATVFGLDGLLRRIVSGKGGARRLNDRALGADDLLEHLSLQRLRLADPGGGKAALEDRNPGVQPGRCLRAGAGKASRSRRRDC